MHGVFTKISYYIYYNNCNWTDQLNTYPLFSIDYSCILISRIKSQNSCNAKAIGKLCDIYKTDDRGRKLVKFDIHANNGPTYHEFSQYAV